MENELTEKLSEFRRLLRKRQHRRYAADGALADPENGQGRIIALLKIKDGISAKDMTYLLGVHFSTLNEFIIKLEKSGYVFKEPSPDDKRIPLVWLTEKGKAVEQGGKGVNGVSDTVAACLTLEEQKVFCGFLERIIAALREELGDDAENHQCGERCFPWHRR